MTDTAARFAAAQLGLVRLERRYAAGPEHIWRMWTTASGIGSWWAPEGFRADVIRLDLRAGGELLYVMTAVGPEQVAFLEQVGLPLRTESRKTFTEVTPHRRLGYLSLIDFVPGQEPYEQLTVVELLPAGEGTRVIMTMEPLHDRTWTDRLVRGRADELDKLARLACDPGSG